jgi:hypothetical protein
VGHRSAISTFRCRHSGGSNHSIRVHHSSFQFSDFRRGMHMDDDEQLHLFDSIYLRDAYQHVAAELGIFGCNFSFFGGSDAKQ